MSGIAGVFNTRGHPVETSFLSAVTSALSHRGPDGAGTWSHGPVALGHFLFATTAEDVQARQPLSLGPHTITFDGLLANRQELLDLLRPPDPSCPDAELALRAYARWGTRCADHLSGDFVFAVWDAVAQQLYCARDALGVRVLYYYFDGVRFIFASEIKGILACPGVPRQLNEEKIGLFLALDEGPADETFYRGVYRLPAGCYLTVSRAGLSRHTYWQPSLEDRIVYPRARDYSDRFLELLKNAVRSRLRSPGPVGVMVSGGLDSSSVYCVAQTLLREGAGPTPQVQTFSWVFHELHSVDESRYVEDLLRQYPTTAHRITGDSLWGLRPFQGRLPPRDEPLIAPYDALLRTTMEEARESGVRVLLTGQGGDEVLYAREHHMMDLLRALRLRRLLREFLALTPRGRRSVLGQLATGLLPAEARDTLTGLLGRALPPWISQPFAHKIGLRSLIKQSRIPSKYGKHYLQSQYELVENRGRSTWILWSNEAAPQHQVELRHPFFDQRLVEFLLRVPPEQKFHRGATKVILRRALKGVLPDSIRLRAGKTSFMPLFDRGMGERELHRFRQRLDSLHLARQGYVDPDRLQRALARYSRSDEYRKTLLFVTFVLEEWLNEMSNGSWGEASSQRVTAHSTRREVK